MRAVTTGVATGLLIVICVGAAGPSAIAQTGKSGGVWQTERAKPTSVAQSLIDTIRCDKPPEPTPLLVKMIRQKYIAAVPNRYLDNDSCFKVQRPLQLAGADGTALHVKYVCAFDDNYRQVTSTPPYMKLYEAGRGAHDGSEIEIYVSDNLVAIQRWNSGNRAGKYLQVWSGSKSRIFKIDRGDLHDLRCNASMFLR